MIPYSCIIIELDNFLVLYGYDCKLDCQFSTSEKGQNVENIIIRLRSLIFLEIMVSLLYTSCITSYIVLHISTFSQLANTRSLLMLKLL